MLSGKVYYDLIKERQNRGMDDDIAFIRVEELAPFPFAQLQEVLELYPNTESYSWLQEEPKNQGAYYHVKDRIVSVLDAIGKGGKSELIYLGRKESPIPAPGVGKLYQVQQRQVLDAAFV